MTKFNIFAKYGSDTKKETQGVPFYLDAEKTAYIKVARWCNRNVEHSKEQAELAKEIGVEVSETADNLRIEVFAKHLVKGWDGVTDADGVEIPFTTENAVSLLQQLPDLADELVGFSLRRENYPLDKLEATVKN